MAMDGTARRRQRPQDATAHTEHDRGQQKAPTEKNLLLVTDKTGNVASRGPTIAGKTHDKKAADAAPIASPTHATLDKDTGLQGYEPEGVLTAQPKKNQKARN